MVPEETLATEERVEETPREVEAQTQAEEVVEISDDEDGGVAGRTVRIGDEGLEDEAVEGAATLNVAAASRVPFLAVGAIEVDGPRCPCAVARRAPLPRAWTLSSLRLTPGSPRGRRRCWRRRSRRP